MLVETGAKLQATGEELMHIYNEESSHTIYFKDIENGHLVWRRATSLNRLCQEQRQIQTWQQNRVQQQSRPCVGTRFYRFGRNAVQ